MLLSDLNWMDVERYLERDDRIILVTGATEQHGYLSLLTDARVPMAIATAVAEREKVLVAPPLNFGVSPYFAAYPGTLSLRQTTFILVMHDLLTGLAVQGFRRIFILNGHGGNTAIRPALIEFRNDRPDVKLYWHDWWTSPKVLAYAEQIGVKPTHANWLENFPFTRVAEAPSAAKPWPELGQLMNKDEMRNALGDGSFGGAYIQPDPVMDHLFEIVVQEVLGLVRAF